MANNILSSAEMTAYWRSKESQLSGDSLSIKLASPEGIALAKRFDKEVYPHTTRLLTVRNRFFESRVLKLLKTDKYDSVISLGSGFSLLTYYISLKSDREIKYFDIDVPELIKFRKERIGAIANDLQIEANDKISMISLDVEEASHNNKTFSETMPKISSPVIIKEGLSYFLTFECLKWIFDGVKQYKNIAFVFDYWPDYAPDVSDGFNKASNFLNASAKENIKVQLSREEILNLIDTATLQEDVEVKDVEPEFLDCPLMDKEQNRWPARFAVVVK